MKYEDDGTALALSVMLMLALAPFAGLCAEA